jgi:uncharacterized repeat protein (TIGR02543 family)
MKKINLHLLTALAVMAVFAACADHFAPPAAEKSPPADGMGRVAIRIAGTEARTFLPDISGITGMTLDYKLIITKDGADTPSVDVTFSGNSWIGDLEAGDYTVEITALVSDTSQMIAQGNKEFTVNKDSSSSVNVVLTTTRSGNGVFSYEVAVSEDITITSGVIQFTSLSGGADPALTILTGSNLSGNINITSGYYRVNLSLVDMTEGLVKTYETTAVAHITDSLTTTAAYNVTGDDFVQRNDIVTNSAELNAALADIRTKPAGEYVIKVAGAFSSEPIELSTGLQNKTIVLQGIGSAEITVTRTNTSGRLFLVDNRVTLILENITLRGINNNYSSLVYVNGKLILRNGGKITGNTIPSTGSASNSTYGAGVYIAGGTLEIAGGEISFNTLSGIGYKYGGGIYVGNAGTVLMTGGVIKGNRVTSSNNFARGGGIHLTTNCRFDMIDGVIEGNTAEGSQAYGGGIDIDAGYFEMLNGTIENNTVYARETARGGGVYYYEGSASIDRHFFNFKGGKIRNNSCYADDGYAYGGGIYIRFNITTSYDGRCTMSGGVINGNTCTSTTYSYGGGVREDNSRSFVKTGGIIYGNDVTGNDSDGIPLRNMTNSAEGGSGHAVYINSSGKFRDTTTWQNDNMDSTRTWDIDNYTNGQWDGFHGNFAYVAYDANGGTGTMANSTHNLSYSSTSKSFTLNAFTRTGYTFVGWARTADGPVWAYDGDVIYLYSYVSAGRTLTLYARWAPQNSDMVWIERGSFQMGGDENDPDALVNEMPKHEVSITNYNTGLGYMGIYPVTQAQYQTVMGSNPSTIIGDNLPIVNVNWYDAVEFCNMLSEIEGLIPVYTIDKSQTDSNNNDDNDTLKWRVTRNTSANGYRLPTEAEWEYAARGGNKSNGYKYSGSDDVEEAAWYNGNSGDTIHAVGMKKPNELGIYDMGGNVSEWCWDWVGAYSSNSQPNPIGANSGSARVHRGGNWGSSAQEVRSAHRGYAGPSYQDSYLGFRVVRYLP